MQPLIDAEGIKKCNKCREEKELSAFHPNKHCSKGVTGTCRDCSRERVNKGYSNNRNQRQSKANEVNQRRKKEIVDHFGNKCNDCGNTYPQYVYQFHHLNPLEKDFNPSYGYTKRPSMMWKELEKCVMLCANCHMIRHYDESHQGDRKEVQHDSVN